MKLIVGVDPGMRTGVAAVDAESDYYKTFTTRGSVGDVCSLAISEGEPIIIATDKAKLPDFVRKVSSSFNARYFSPAKDASIEEKKKITRDMRYANSHEMDALASALSAKKEYSRMFGRVDAFLKDKGMLRISGEVKELLVKGDAANMEQALKMLSVGEKKGVVYVPRWIESKRVYELKKKVGYLERIIERQSEAIRLLQRPESRPALLPPRPPPPKPAKGIPEGYETVHMPGDDVKRKIFLVKSQKEVRSVEQKEPVMLIADFVPNAQIPFVSSKSISVERHNGLLAVRKTDAARAFNEAFANYIGLYKRRFHEV